MSSVGDFIREQVETILPEFQYDLFGERYRGIDKFGGLMYITLEYLEAVYQKGGINALMDTLWAFRDLAESQDPGDDVLTIG